MITREEYLELKERYNEGYRWIARDENCDLCAFKVMPTKFISFWTVNTGSPFPRLLGENEENILTCVTWEDEEPTKIDDLIRDYESHQVIVGESEKVTIPSFVADWIEEVKGTYTLKLLFTNSNMPSSVKDWLYCNNKNCEKMALAWIYGYEVEKEKQYILKFSNGQYLYNCDLGMADESLGCKLTKAEIEAVDPRLMQFAVEVE